MSYRMDTNHELLLKAEYTQTLWNDLEANQLLDEIQTTIKEVQQSEFYLNILQQLQHSPHFQNNIQRVLLDGCSDVDVDNRLQMVIFGLGTIQFSYRSQYQLAMAISLSRDLSHWIKPTIHTFDPRTTPIDAKVMKALDIQVEYINERLGRRVNGRPTLFFMPFVNSLGLKNLFGVNWRPSDLKNIILFTNVYQKRLDKKNLYSQSILKHTISFDCHYNYEGPLTGTRRRSMSYKVSPNVQDFTSPGHFEWYPHSSVEERGSLLESMQDFRHATWPGRSEWCPPYRGWIKLNFTAANCSQQGGKGGGVGYGGIFQDEKSECLLSYSGPVLDDPDEDVASDNLDFLNAVALRRGLRLFIELPSRPIGRRLIIEGDSVSIVRWANRLVPPPKRITDSERFIVFCLVCLL